MYNINATAFSKKNAFRCGWDTFRKDIFFWSGLALFVVLTQSSTVLVKEYFPAQSGGYMFTLQVIGWFLQVVVGMGLVRVTLNVVDGKVANTQNFFSCFRFFFRYLAASLIFGLLFAMGLLFFILPGIFIAIKLQFYEYYIIDKDMGIMESFVASARVTRGLVPDLFIMGVMILFVNLAGFLVLGIGILATVPISKIAITHVYRQLVPADNLQPPETTE